KGSPASTPTTWRIRKTPKPISRMNAAARSRERNNACVSFVRWGPLPATISRLGQQTSARSLAYAAGCRIVSSSRGRGRDCSNRPFIGQPPPGDVVPAYFTQLGQLGGRRKGGEMQESASQYVEQGKTMNIGGGLRNPAGRQERS